MTMLRFPFLQMIKTPSPQELAAQAAAARKAMKAELDAALKQKATKGDALAKKLAEIEEDIRTKYREYLAWERGRFTELNDVRSQLVRLDGAVDHSSMNLVRSANPLIGKFIDAMRDERDEIKRLAESDAVYEWKESGRGFVNRVVKWLNNQPSIMSAVEAINLAIERTKSLELEALSDDELSKRLQQIAATIPERESVKGLTEVA